MALALFSVSSTSLVIKYLPDVPALTMAFWRMFFAGVMLWVYSLFKPTPPLNKKSLNRVGIAGFFLGLHFACFFWGVRNTSIANATLLANTGPLFTVGLTFLLHRTISKQTLLPLFVAFAGVFLIQLGEFSVSSNYFLGNAVSLFSSLCIAIVYIIAKQIRKENNTVAYGRTLFLFASATISIVSLIMNVSIFSFEKEHVFWFLFLGLVPSILGHNTLNYAVKYLSPTAVASIPLGEPVIASFLGLILLSESIPANSIQGAPFIFFGVYFIIKNSKNATV